jgi:exopolysaccharide biosynthesis protein
MIVVNENQKYTYYHRSIEFGYSVHEWESEHDRQVTAALTNYPALIEDGSIVVDDEPMDNNQENTKSTRGGIGFNAHAVFLVIASNATVPDLASIMKEIGASYAMNLDGGGSAAMYYNGSYVAGPGRQLPNAIVFRKR